MKLKMDIYSNIFSDILLRLYCKLFYYPFYSCFLYVAFKIYKFYAKMKLNKLLTSKELFRKVF